MNRIPQPETARVRLEPIVAAVVDSVVMTDAEQRIVVFNASAERLFGHSASEVLGRPLSMLLPERFREAHDRMVRAFGAGAPSERRMGGSRDVIALRADGTEFGTEASISHTVVDGQSFYTVVLRDEGARGQAAKRTTALNAELEARVAERTAALTASLREMERFSYTISHDLRAPLRAIDGYASMLREEEAARLSPEGVRLLDALSDNARRMASLIDGLLRFSRLARAKLAVTPVDLNRLVLDACAAVQGPEDRVRFDLQRLPPVQGDRDLLREVWMQLLANAVKFSAGAEFPRVEVGFKESAEGPIFHVRDNGAGFDMAYYGKLFGVFNRLHHASEFEGVGVGLAIARRVIELHGGTIRAESAPGRGATFHFTLGGALPEVARERCARPRHNQADGGDAP